MQADYDADGRTDLAVFGNGRWSIDLGLAAVLSPAGVPVPSLYPPRTWR